MQNVTFGITTFNRPMLLRQLIDSIRLRYPSVRIVVADNGDEQVTLPDNVQVIRLPFDCGLSRARNALIDHLQTDYLLVLEDDFQFTDETDIEPLRQVLDSAADVGVVGGAIRGIDGRVTCYALDIEVCRQTMRVREATHRVEITPSGIPYRICDMVWNFALFRRTMLHEHRWVDALKIGEHCPFFYEVKLASRWRVASCSLPKIFHVPDRRPAKYMKYRRRAADYFHAYLSARGINRYQRVLPYHYEDEPNLVPPVIVLAVGHSGTSVVTRMLQGLGWSLGKVDKVFAEHIEIRRLNRTIIDHGKLDCQAAKNALSSLPNPWAVKDPRFVQTLDHWLPHFAQLECKPVLLRLRREPEATQASYERRGAPGDVRRRVEQLARSRDRLYQRWPWRRLTLEYENIAAAAAMFDLRRFESSRQAAASRAVASRTEISRPPLTTPFDSSFAVDSAIALDSAISTQVRFDSLLPLTAGSGVELDSSFAPPESPDTREQADSVMLRDLEAKLKLFVQQQESGSMDEIDGGAKS